MPETDKKYTPTRNVMNAAELRTHHISDWGRDYSLSCDGEGDMEVSRRDGWRAISGWGRDGWDLGDWPYNVLYFRETDSDIIVEGKLDKTFDLLQIVEGDRSYYEFETEADRDAATDYIFLWHAMYRPSRFGEWAEQIDSAKLDAGELDIESKYRGPFSWARCEAEKDDSGE